MTKVALKGYSHQVIPISCRPELQIFLTLHGRDLGFCTFVFEYGEGIVICLLVTEAAPGILAQGLILPL
jgi:hypothetical protein